MKSKIKLFLESESGKNLYRNLFKANRKLGYGPQRSVWAAKKVSNKITKKEGN